MPRSPLNAFYQGLPSSEEEVSRAAGVRANVSGDAEHCGSALPEPQKAFIETPPFQTVCGKLLLSTAETQRILSIGKTKLFELLASGDLASITIGSRRLIVAASVHQLIGARA